MKKKVSVPKLKMTLLENSRSFLVEALSKALLAEADVYQWKFAVLNMCQAIEISLKERLHREHHAFLWDNIDNGTITVTPKKAIARLSKLCGVTFSKEDLATIEKIKTWRNQIVHNEISLNINEVKPAFSILFGFLRTFHETILAEKLSDHIPVELWKEALDIDEYVSELYDRATQQAKDEGVDFSENISCLHCGYFSCVLKDDVCYCYVCGSEEELIECDSCHHHFPESQVETIWHSEEGTDYEESTCQRCQIMIEYDDMYADYMHDWIAGK